MTYVSICTDMDALRATGAVDVDSPYRGMIDGRSGAHVYYNGNQSMIVLTSIDGLEALAEFPFVTVTSFEEIFGYRRQAVIDGEPQWTTETGTTPGYFREVPTGEYVDGDPIYVVERVETPTTRTVTDENGVETTVPGRPIVEYVTTDVIDGYKQVPVTEQVWVEAEPYTRTVPLYEDVQAVPEMAALYASIYDRTPVTDTEGNTHTPSKLFAVPGGYDTGHLL